MKKKFCGSLLAILLTVSAVKAQDTIGVPLLESASATDTAYWRTSDVPETVHAQKWEITSNVTLALSRFSGNVTRNLNDDPYLLMVRKLNNNGQSAWRYGLNGFRRKSEDVTGGFQGSTTRTSEENSVSLVIGREWRHDLAMGFYTYWGLDARGLFRQNLATSVQFDGFSGRTEIVTDAKEYGGSFGCIGGIGYKFNDRMIVYTESLIYGQYLRTDRQFSVNGIATPLEQKNTISVLPMVPVALFLSIQF